MGMQSDNMKDIVDKYYFIASIFNDDLKKVATAIRMAGADQRPSFIFKDLEYIWVGKYSEQIDHLYSTLQDKHTALIFSGVINAIYRCGAKYKFDPIQEVKKGEIMTFSHDSHVIKQEAKVDGVKHPTLF
jgi:hypothetical protein